MGRGLEVAADVALLESEVVTFAVRETWLCVRLDGREGWITGSDSFERVGLEEVR